MIIVGILLLAALVPCFIVVLVQMAQQTSKQTTEQTAEPKQTTEKASQQTAEQTAQQTSQQTSQQTNEIIYNIDISNIEIISFGIIVLLLYLVISSDNPIKSLKNHVFRTYRYGVQNVPLLRTKGISEEEAIKRMSSEGMISTVEVESKMEDLVKSNSNNNYSFDTVDDLPGINPDKKIAYVVDGNSYYYWSGTEWLKIENMSQ